MTDNMIKVMMFLGDNGQKELSRELCAENARNIANARKPLFDMLLDAPRPANISSPHGQIIEPDNAMFHKAYFDWYKKARAILTKEGK